MSTCKQDKHYICAKNQYPEIFKSIISLLKDTFKFFVVICESIRDNEDETPKEDVEDELDEITVIVMAHALANPRTVMIHLKHTSIAS